MKHRLYSE
ncbi:Protein F14 (1), partial [Monkeypox virus]